tara:strand:- start:102 stop:251 length:150 start_codon:yes stop_codon:yes gene_type:complete
VVQEQYHLQVKVELEEEQQQLVQLEVLVTIQLVVQELLLQLMELLQQDQ